MTVSVCEADSQSSVTRISDPAFQRIQLVGQLRLLLLRAERGLHVDADSVLRAAVLVREIEVENEDRS